MEQKAENVKWIRQKQNFKFDMALMPNMTISVFV